jgi:MFS family permease
LGGPQNPRVVNWRANLLALWFNQLTTLIGIAGMVPFLALYLATDLGVHDLTALALWTGAAGAAMGLGQAMTAPLWGMLADRFGRKRMLIRALIGGGLALIAISFARNPLDLVILRFIYGAISGPMPVALSIISSETPRARLGTSIGLMNAAAALGQAIGPPLGGLVGSYLGVRQIFLAGGLTILASSSLVFPLVHESSRPRRFSGTEVSGRLRDLSRGTMFVLLGLLGVQGLIYFSMGGMYPVVALRILTLAPHNVAFQTGLLFGAYGLANAVSSFAFGPVSRRFGYRNAGIVAAAMSAVAFCVMASSQSAPILLGAMIVNGLGVGIAAPCASTMIALVSPQRNHSAIFGFSWTFQSLGFGLGPAIGGALMAFGSVALALVVLSGVTLAAAFTFRLGTHEPETPTTVVPAPSSV